MQLVQQILFIIVSGVAIYLFAKKLGEIRRNILLGRDEDLTDNPSQRWKNMTLLALGQQKMFKRPVPAILHLFVYAGFIIINIEILEIILDGILGQHRLFAPLIGGLYGFLIGCFEILAALVLIGCAIFLIRRNITKVPRLVKGELSAGWPKSDANIILITEIILMGLFLSMDTADLVLQSRGIEHYTQTDAFWITSNFTGMFDGLSTSTLVAIERGGWWLHIIGVLAFMNYLPYSKHFHILVAFPNAYYMRIKPQGEMMNMQAIQNEVLYMMEPDKAPTDAAPAEPQSFGAKDVFDLSWKNLMDAYACTECGRCSAMCPANQTGKKLSPRKIMMDTRDRLEEVGANINKNKEFVDDGKKLIHDYISAEELRACTTCQACVEACPVSIDPLNIIYQLRRYLIMEESNSPEEWNLMFSNVENNMAPWKFSPDDRDKWVEELAEA
ncbi:MAG: (Fe-S)-binding protein [Chitinophagaceae bacterium]|nr:(Fe-S)-binding protein [Chitinophagaceae bacterium]